MNLYGDYNTRRQYFIHRFRLIYADTRGVQRVKAKIHIVDEIYDREKTFINFAAFSELTAFAQLSTDCFHEMLFLKFRKVSP